jgi:uncharacterized protein (TIGR00255 family)
MTGFARHAGADSATSWVWELRSVNGRGLDVRLKIPAALEKLEPKLKQMAAARLARGSVQANLALRGAESGGVVIDHALLARFTAEARALAAAHPGTQAPRAELLLALPGVIRRDTTEDTPLPDSSAEAILADFDQALSQLATARLAEGDRLATLVRGLLAQFATLRTTAATAAADQPRQQQARMEQSLATLLAGKEPVPEARLAQEVALLAIRADVTEEIDRLGSHLNAAATLLATGGPAGRQLDFLVQEFVRETNTLCSKSASPGLTATGLQMKAIIEQVREQVQNIE